MEKYTFELHLEDKITPKLNKIKHTINSLSPFKKFNAEGEEADNTVKKISNNFKHLTNNVKDLNKQYNANRQKILELKRASLSASAETRKGLSKEIKLLRQENSEIKEKTRLNKKTGILSGATGSILKAGGAMAGIGLAFGAIRGAGNFLGSSVRASNIQQQAEAQVKTGMLSNGNSGGFSLSQYKKMASNLQSNSIVGDENILKNVTAQFLTFGNITGKVFSKAQKQALDMSARTGLGLKQVSVMMGKALNDPIKGINALSRAGVQFTDNQKEQIKNYTKAGELGKAQAIMQKELQKEFGGSAKAQAESGTGALKQLKNSFGDLKEKLGNLIIPLLNKAALFGTHIVKLLPDIFNKIKTGFVSVWNDIKDPVMAIFTPIKEYAIFIFNFYKNIFGGIRKLFSSQSKLFGKFFKSVFSNLKNILKVIGSVVSVIFKAVKIIVILIGKALGWIFKQINETIIKPLVKVFAWVNKKVIDPILKGLTSFFSWLNKKLSWLLGKIDKDNKETTKKNKSDKEALVNKKLNEDSNKNKSIFNLGSNNNMLNSTSSLQPEAQPDINLKTDNSVKKYVFNIKSLVEELVIKTTELKESDTEVEGIITRMLQKAITDVQAY